MTKNYLQLFLRRYRLFKYNRSKLKKELDWYCQRIRKLETLTDEEWEQFRALAQNEKRVYNNMQDYEIIPNLSI